MPPASPIVAVALKWVPLRVEVDPLSGAVETDERFTGCSAADQAALEWGLRLAAAWGGTVVAVTAGPAGADALLRDALAAGADRAIRVDLATGAPSEEAAVAVADACADADVVCCGDHSLDRGTGSVPAFVAAHRGAAQALGLVRVEPDAATPGRLRAVRRLDHGRREVLDVAAPAVLSFEGGTAELRRAPLAALLAARTAELELLPHPGRRAERTRVVRRSPYRPRPRVLAAPAPELGVRERILSLTGALTDRQPPRTVTCDANEAADLLLEQLRVWGHLDPTTAPGAAGGPGVDGTEPAA